jgi:peptidyl-prolyl cis-trans isomerase C
MLRTPRLLFALTLSLAFTASAQPAPDGGAPRPEDTARRAQVLARLGERTVTVGEFEDMLNEAPEPVRQSYLNPARRREQLESLLNTMLLADEARRRGVDRDPQVAATVRRILSQRWEQRTILEAITPDSIPAEEVARHYQEHLSDYQQPEFRRATVIITRDQAAAATAAEGCRTARGDLRRVRALVREHSVDEPTRSHEGDAFYFQREGQPSGDGQPVDPALAAAVFALARETDVTAPVPLRDGRFGVAVLTGIRPALRRALTDPGVTASIRGFLVRDRRSRREAELLQAIRARLNPEVHEDRLQLLRLPPSDLGNLPGFQPAAPSHPPH